MVFQTAMGYSFYYPLIMYGFVEKSDDMGMFLDDEWVREHYEGVYCRADEVSKNYKCDNVVGIYVRMSPDGKLSYDGEEYKTLLRLKEDYETFHEKTVVLEYHTAIGGDYQDDEVPKYTFEDE